MSHHRLSTPPGIIVPPWRYYMTLVEQASVPGDPPGVVPPWRYHMTLVEQASVPGDVQPRYCSTMALPYDVGGTRLGSRRPQHIGSVTLLHYCPRSARRACRLSGLLPASHFIELFSRLSVSGFMICSFQSRNVGFSHEMLASVAKCSLQSRNVHISREMFALVSKCWLQSLNVRFSRKMFASVVECSLQSRNVRFSR